MPRVDFRDDFWTNSKYNLVYLEVIFWKKREDRRVWCEKRKKLQGKCRTNETKTSTTLEQPLTNSTAKPITLPFGRVLEQSARWGENLKGFLGSNFQHSRSTANLTIWTLQSAWPNHAGSTPSDCVSAVSCTIPFLLAPERNLEKASNPLCAVSEKGGMICHCVGLYDNVAL